MSFFTDLSYLPTSEELLTDDVNTPAMAQISQDPLQGAVYKLRVQVSFDGE